MGTPRNSRKFRIDSEHSDREEKNRINKLSLPQSLRDEESDWEPLNEQAVSAYQESLEESTLDVSLTEAEEQQRQEVFFLELCGRGY